MELTKEQKVRLYTNMVRARKMDEYIVAAFNEKRIASPFFHSQQGQEAIGAGACSFLRQDDALFYPHRGHGLCELVSKGLPLKMFLAEHDGRVTGSCRGIGCMNSCYLEQGIYGLDGCVAGELRIAAGVALAAKMKGKGQVVVSISGDGALGEGHFHEALLMIANWKLPVVVIVANNRYQMWVPTSAAYPRENVADFAYGYNIPSEIVDGQDVLAVNKAVQAAVDKARAGQGPSFIECKTYHYRSHMEGCPQYRIDALRSAEEEEEWKKRDPIVLYRENLLKEGVVLQSDIIRVESEVEQEIREAAEFAQNSPHPTSDILEKALYAN